MDNGSFNDSQLGTAALILAEQKSAVLSAIVASSDDAIFSETLQGQITSWNQAAERMFGYPEEEAVGQHCSFIIPRNRLKEESFIISEIGLGNHVEHFETDRLARDGSLVPISLSVSPVVDDQGTVIGMSKIARDISERQKADEKQARLAAIVQTSDDVIISKTLQGIITSWNPAAERLFGYTEQEVVGKHISIIIPPDRLTEEDSIIANIISGRKVDHFETLRVTKDGRMVPLSVTVSPITDVTGKIIGASKIARDISEYKKAAEKQSTLAAIIDSSDDCILSKTLDGMITSWNKAAEKMFGYTEQEAIGKHISLIIPTERLAEEQYIIGEVRKGKKIDHFHTVRLAKDGTQISISLSVSPIFDNKGQIVGASKIARDITEQLAAQEENSRLYKQVKELSDRKDEFIGIASHELKTPLTSVHGYLQILTRTVKDERSLIFIQKGIQQLKKAHNLISDLLDVSKIETGKLQLNPERFDICKVTKEVIEMLSNINKQVTITLVSSIKEVFITADPDRTEQVIINLLTNALRYSPGAEQIIVKLGMEENMVKIGVQDFGIGIQKDKLHDIFSKYYRVNEGQSQVSGLGLGLYLCHEIVSRQNGRIWVESEPGTGSTFWFTLPA